MLLFCSRIAEAAMSAMLRVQALHALAVAGWQAKRDAVQAIGDDLPVGADVQLNEPPGLPGRPARPELVPRAHARQRSVRSPLGRAMLLHSLAHIEFNAINLALDAIWRYPGQPDDYYRDWLRVAREEAYHFDLLNRHLATLGHVYGDFPAHNGLWEMAEKTRGDLLARLALVPRTLEARGLDAAPLVRAKLLDAGDTAGAAILDIILRDEIGHVAIGNRWFRLGCQARGLDVVSCYADLARRYGAPPLRGPFNLPARRAAGFDDDEIAALLREPGAQSQNT